MNKLRYDVIVIGAGIIGNCIAYELARSGRRSLVVDKLGGSGFGTTAASCAIIRLHYSTPQGVALAREGYYYWLDWKRYLKTPDPTGMASYKNTGNLIFKTEVNRNLENVKAALDEMGIGYLDLEPETIDAFLPDPDLRAYHPQKTLDDPAFGTPTRDRIAGAIYVPESGYVSDPKQSAHNVEVAARAAGADYRFNAEVVAILKRNGRVDGVRLAGGMEIGAPVVVNVSGPHSHQINQMAGVETRMKIKTRALRVEVAHVESPEGVDWERNGVMMSDSDTGVYSRPELGNHWLIGSEEPACDSLEYVDPDNYNPNFTDQARVQVLRAGIRIPGLPVPNQLRGMVSLYDLSDDWYPIYDKSDLPGFYMAVGTSGNQYKNAPVAGAFMAELIDYCEKGGDHDRHPLQYRMKYLKRSLDIGFFSRNREINRASSFSVIG
ncbi:FAD-dependent oxidoreductase [Desulfosarcina alkanivorans]|uniref:FAD-dependent oxidoreductase n=1 Tax=Desulfosarcina alkanivorans TaxID=571177 RepID=A0A5K7YUA2_9BACT|nr:FAD-dependent oxidoreductase [Desulfosarcina alkanivorans]BBO72005.1 FAD-dependent oxidoreductase [Desulfosarcina alkanivorans]